VPPQNVPCIFVCAPHHNQFLDPLVVTHAVARPDLCFLTAAKSMRSKIIGTLARFLDSIPVERSADAAFKGSGMVWLSPEDGATITGRATKFTTEVHIGDSIELRSGEPLVVEQVVSDESLIVRRATSPAVAPPGSPPLPAPADSPPLVGGGDWRTYTVMPKVDHSQMFDAVTTALHGGKAVGIFPEGGSHDRPSLLPFRAGVAIMALEALAKHPTMPLRLVPVGLNYFSGHRFRSRVFVDIGEPLSVPPHLLPRYLEGGSAKRAATRELMETVNAALSGLTINAPDYETLEFFWTLRRLAKSSSGILSLDEQTELARRFSLGYERVMPDGRKWKDTERVQNVQSLSSEYNARLKTLGLRDYQVAHVMNHMGRTRAACLLLGRVVTLLLLFVLWLPMTLLHIPLLLVTRAFSTYKANQAVQASSVKILGRDVLATWKLLISLVLWPSLWLLYTCLSGLVCDRVFGLSLFWQREVQLLVFFFFPPLTLLYIFNNEMLAAVARSLPPLAMIIIDPSSSSNIASQREDLRLKMVELLDDDLGWRDVDKSGIPSPRDSLTGGGWAKERWGEQWLSSHSSLLVSAASKSPMPDSPPSGAAGAALPEKYGSFAAELHRLADSLPSERQRAAAAPRKLLPRTTTSPQPAADRVPTPGHLQAATAAHEQEPPAALSSLAHGSAATAATTIHVSEGQKSIVLPAALSEAAERPPRDEKA
jgi:glycerol-3-phosphate O-acyltransferase/dihydroxyacetone phosphate acyltransferase